MKYNLGDSSDNLVIISDIDAMYKKVVNEFGDEAIFINPYCIQCGAKIDVKKDNFTFYQAEEGIDLSGDLEQKDNENKFDPISKREELFIERIKKLYNNQ